MSLILNNVSKVFEDSKEDVLYQVNLKIKKGEFVCVVGRSGCGKSTLLNLIAGLEKPTDGEIILNGKTVTEPGADRTVMFQEHALFPWLNVIQNVKFGMKMKGVPKQEQEEKAMKYLRMVGLEEYKAYAVHQLSGGMRQRVALARAMTMDSEILLMDEPFSALDKQTSNRLRAELQDMWLRTKQTILFITHSVEEAVYLADRVVILSPSARMAAGEVCWEQRDMNRKTSMRRSIMDIVPVELPRPRHVYDAEFVEYRRKILKKVEGNLKNEK